MQSREQRLKLAKILQPLDILVTQLAFAVCHARQYARLAMLAQLHLNYPNCAIIDAQMACRTVLGQSPFTPRTPQKGTVPERF